jgi:hypothetical protein
MNVKMSSSLLVETSPLPLMSFVKTKWTFYMVSREAGSMSCGHILFSYILSK